MIGFKSIPIIIVTSLNIGLISQHGYLDQEGLNPNAGSVSEPHRLVYSTFRPANWDIYLFESPGADPRRLTEGSSLDYNAVFSPDGRWLVFTSERRGTTDIYALNLHDENAEPLLLIDSPAFEDQAAFSPDGQSLAFVGTLSGTADIYRIPFRPDQVQTMDEAEQLTDHPSGNFRPAFSPDGTRIAFSSDRNYTPWGWPGFPFSRQREGDLYVLDLDSRELTRLTDTPGWDGSPVWSPDGKSIFFYSAGGEHHTPPPFAPTQRGGFRIYSIPSGGGEARPISPEGIEALSPRRGADSRLVFVTREGIGYKADWSVVSVTPGGDDLRLKSKPGNNCWNPDVHSSGAMVCHGPGPYEESGIPAQSQIAPASVGPGPMLAPGFPVEREIVPGIRAKIYPMRNALEVAPHPFRNEIAVPANMEDQATLLIADMKGNTLRKLHVADDLNTPHWGVRWSKDGTRVTFSPGPFLGTLSSERDVWIVDVNSGESMNVTRSPETNDGMPDFSQDGEWLIFRGGRDGQFDLYAIRTDGTDIRQLTSDPWRVNHVASSPVDDRIAFIYDRDGVNYPIGTANGSEQSYFRTTDIYLMEFDPAGEPAETARLTENAMLDAHPIFSPDGQWLIFTSERGGINDEEPLIQELMFSPQLYGDIYALSLDDGHIVRLTHDRWENGTAFWMGPVKETAD